MKDFLSMHKHILILSVQFSYLNNLDELYESMCKNVFLFNSHNPTGLVYIMLCFLLTDSAHIPIT